MSLSRVQPLLRRLNPVATAAAVTTTSTRNVTNCSWVKKDYVEDKEWMPNGAMKRGPRSFCGGWDTKDGGHTIWIMMPGVPKENITVDFVGRVMDVVGVEDLTCPGVTFPSVMGRTYSQCIEFDPTRFDGSRAKAEILNGIFWVHAPKLSH